jgi:two-component system LytT family response regulator
MIRALVIDDVKNARELLIRYLSNYCPEIEVVAEAGGVTSGLEAISKYSPDVVFLDILMADGTGFNLLEKLGKITFKTIFVTAYSDFAIKAFKFSAVDYLLKPIDIEELKTAVKKIGLSPALHSSKEMIDVLLDNISNHKNTSGNIVLSSQENSRIVRIDEIVRCEARDNYTLFNLLGGEVILVTKTLKEYDELLSEYGFVRVHKSHLINSSYIQKYIKSDKSYLVTIDNSQVPVSLRKKKEVQDMLQKIRPSGRV